MKALFFKVISVVMSVFLFIPMMAGFITENMAHASYCVDSEIIEEGYYRIYSVAAHKYLDVFENSTDNGAVIHIWDKSDVQSQIFKLTRNNDDSFTITANHSGKVVEVRNSSCEEWGEIGQWEDANIATQHWYIQKAEKYYYKICNANSSLYISLRFGCCDNGTPVIQYRDDGTSSELFRFEKLSVGDMKSAHWSAAASSINYDSAYMYPTTVKPFDSNSYILAENKSSSKYAYEDGEYIYYPSSTSVSLDSVYYISRDELKKIIKVIGNKNIEKNRADKLIDNATKIIDFALKKCEIPGLTNLTYSSIKYLANINELESDIELSKFYEAGVDALANIQTNGIVIRAYITSSSDYEKVYYSAVDRAIGVSGRYTINHFDKMRYEYIDWTGDLNPVINANGSIDVPGSIFPECLPYLCDEKTKYERDKNINIAGKWECVY